MPDEQLEKTRISLERIQGFDTAALPREAQLGEALNFGEAVEPANRVINLFRQFPIEFLPELPDNQLIILMNAADSFHQILSQILQFDPKQQEAYNARTSLVQNLKGQYQNYFGQLYQLIAYGSSRQRDFSALERDFRASMQRAEDSATATMGQLGEQRDDAARILEEVRKVAAEQGVSQQARYFQSESEAHDIEARRWGKWTVWTAIGLISYSVLTMFLHKLPWLQPSNPYETFQFGLSKVLVFVVLAYMLLLCARNFLSHKHNSIVNKHRQNALLTFNALVEAAGGAEQRDVVLTYAAACIFSPQDTGYTKAGGATVEMPTSIIQALPKIASSGAAH
jgi:hypothetical protein